MKVGVGKVAERVDVLQMAAQMSLVTRTPALTTGLASWPPAGAHTRARGRGGHRRGQQLVHEVDVSDRESQSLDTRQSFLIGESWNLGPKSIESLVEIKHPSPFPDVRRPSLAHSRHPPPLLGRLLVLKKLPSVSS